MYERSSGFGKPLLQINCEALPANYQGVIRIEGILKNPSIDENECKIPLSDQKRGIMSATPLIKELLAALLRAEEYERSEFPFEPKACSGVHTFDSKSSVP